MYIPLDRVMEGRTGSLRLPAQADTIDGVPEVQGREMPRARTPAREGRMR